jgi:DNA-binding IscR family transcriptional regulator
MAVNTQFSIAVHILAGLACGCDTAGVTSGHLAESVNTSASFVRRTLAKLLDIYRAVDAPKAFSIHSYSEQKICFVSCHIKTALEKVLTKTQKAMEASLAEISLAQIVSDVKKK